MALPVVAVVVWGTRLVVQGVAGPCAVGLVIGTVVLIDRWRAPLRNICRLPAIGGERDVRDVASQVDRLLERGDFMRAHHATVAICTWPQRERHYGSTRRQRQLTAALASWTARRGEYDKRAELI
ncbi:hypothetical protein [Amycolatopsis sp. cmx-4-61]|uniref:hypothetical protein n=1 Tax=Amycolatopsis sp. cmx-4-61 TaxID=2790937 RepID=UPI00397D77E3